MNPDWDGRMRQQAREPKMPAFPRNRGERLKPCLNPLCDRLVTMSVAYCCHPCGLANEGHYEIHPDGPLGHTDLCEQRRRERS